MDPCPEENKYSIDFFQVPCSGCINVDFKGDRRMLCSNLEVIIALIYFSGTKIRDKFVPSLLSGSEGSSDWLYLMQIKTYYSCGPSRLTLMLEAHFALIYTFLKFIWNHNYLVFKAYFPISVCSYHLSKSWQGACHGWPWWWQRCESRLPGRESVAGGSESTFAWWWWAYLVGGGG